MQSHAYKNARALAYVKKNSNFAKFTNNEFANIYVDGDGELKLKNDCRWTGISNIRNLVKIKR